MSWAKLLTLGLLVSAPFATASPVTASSSLQGDVSDQGFANPVVYFTFMGKSTNVNGTVWRAFWVFDLPSGLAPVTEATFVVQPSGYFGDGAQHTVVFTDFLLSPSLLSASYTAGDATGQSIFADLGAGAVYGQLNVVPSDARVDCSTPSCTVQPGHTLSLKLNSAGLSAINAKLGASFVIGGYVSTTSPNLVGDSDGVQLGTYFNHSIAELQLQSVPEPGTASLFVLAGLAAFARQRFRRRSPGSQAALGAAPGHDQRDVVVLRGSGGKARQRLQ
ncbi:PEP-CTERM sorting domain-containing protein [Paludibaculum fermentans]|uniref:PEP-CTERM sorting domain-containing protein n=1 Tax=Paludibaculum fermentans TaxID=1473598 RepID=A0A7S7NRB7_PALFE|nr:PEP-CTERM sorting domain-containing protein [Paludibaculum fermentans]QOY88256.1 PEP-CTERM sorting domain-containing protein [Paludibaculum fermentans]